MTCIGPKDSEHASSALEHEKDASYEEPQVISLGKTHALIRGYWNYGSGDHGGGWYITGE